MKRSLLKLHATRGVSSRASEMMTRSGEAERHGRTLTATAKRAGLAMVEAIVDGREPREEDVLVFADAVDPAWGRWLRGEIAQAEQNEREMKSDAVYFPEDE